MKQVTENTKIVADKHIAAKLNNSFDDIEVKNMDEVLLYIAHGKTFSKLMNYVESKNSSIGSSLLSGVFNYNSDNYKNSIYKGFQQFFNEVLK